MAVAEEALIALAVHLQCLSIGRGLREKPGIYGAGNRIRTYDPRITNALLYQLSYPGAGAAIL